MMMTVMMMTVTMMTRRMMTRKTKMKMGTKKRRMTKTMRKMSL